MSVQDKLRILADAAKYDASCASGGSSRQKIPGEHRFKEANGICHSYTPDGRCVSLLKILLTNYCVYDCLYCVNRISSDTPRARFTPEEVVKLTLDFYRRNYIEGLFLSSGIIQSADYTMEQLVSVAKTLRTEHGFRGYIHLKAIPGASAELLREAGRHADRLSVNIELPTRNDLLTLAPAKKIETIESSMNDIRQEILRSEDERAAFASAPLFTPAGQSTQLIVGATPSTDSDILEQSKSLYESHRLKRVYYSAFSPIPHSSPLLPVEAAPMIREHRLYQADWLYRFYGFRIDEIVSPKLPNLRLDMDPKLAWALSNKQRFPIDLNRAPREDLLRIPGLGVRSVDRILQARRHRAIRFQDLRTLRIPLSRVKYFVQTADRNPLLSEIDRADFSGQAVRPKQMSLFDFNAQTAAVSHYSALTGEL